MLRHFIRPTVRLIRANNIVRRSLSLTLSTTRIKNVVTSRKFLATGLSVGLGTALYVYSTPESILIRKIRKAFNRETTYKNKLLVYSTIPEPKLPVFSSTTSDQQLTTEKWADLVEDGFNFLNKSHLWNLVKELRESLLQQVADEFSSLEDRLKELKRILPDSLELYLAMEKQLDAELKKTNMVSMSLLKENSVKSREISSMDTRLLKLALLSYVGPVDFFSVVQGEMSVDEFMGKLDMNTCGFDGFEKIKLSIVKITNQFLNLDPMIRANILEDVGTVLIEKLMAEKKDLYNTTLNKQLFDKLALDSQVNPVINQFATVVKSLPARKQARILLTAFKKYDSNLDFLKAVFASDGIVAIKLCQMLSEEPCLPIEYREKLSEFREANVPMTILDFYNQIPISISEDVDYLIERVGVGSVKDVWKVKMKDGSDKICAVVRKGIEEDAVATLKALDKIEEISGLAGRIRRTVFREMDLWLEYDAFEELRKTDFGKSDFVAIPKVSTNTMGCLLRDIGCGKTVAKVLSCGLESEKKELLQYIPQLHKIAVATALDKGFIMSDLHFGNMSYDSENKKLVLFDPGQNDVLSKDQSNVLLWIFVALSDRNMMKKFKTVAVNKMATVVESGSNSSSQSDVITRLGRAFDSCSSEKDIKSRYTKLMVATEKERVTLPSGFFATGKMLNVLLAQEELLQLTPAINEEIKKIMWKNISGVEKAELVGRYLFY